MGVEPFLLASSLEGVLAQRLVRKICSKCKVPYKPDESLLQTLNGSSASIGPDTVFYRGEGCNECNKTGMSGRKGIFELLRMTVKIRDLISQKATTEQIIRAAPEDHISMMESGMSLVLQGVTTPEEVLRVAKSVSEDDI
jgi:type II secretory ATPase GspE/PulE/Tfp pilus assembly ATPase PilB-like protein